MEHGFRFSAVPLVELPNEFPCGKVRLVDCEELLVGVDIGHVFYLAGLVAPLPPTPGSGSCSGTSEITTWAIATRGTMGTVFDDLGFSHNYVVEVDPEFPGNGQWNCTTIGITADGEPTEFLDSRWGIPLVLRVAPDAAPDWVLSVSGGSGLTRLRGIFATPRPDEFLAVVDGAGLVVRADDPSHVHPLGVMVTQVFGAVEPNPVLLISRAVSVVAIDAGGVRWRSSRQCWDDLTIERIEGNEVHCSGEFMPRAPFVLDLLSGQRLAGPLFAGPP